MLVGLRQGRLAILLRQVIQLRYSRNDKKPALIFLTCNISRCKACLGTVPMAKFIGILDKGLFKSVEWGVESTECATLLCYLMAVLGREAFVFKAGRNS